ncbi:MarR family winged helix-turn-helix transcriptional regulator [Oceanobacillus jordanicus]|uniref:MarR family winged helix-turn-helix transcriptional regulator n=1 Tax=Oceanobacillus jordanicus TaxID=2867266 RepID=A0AAW5B9E2_9BACI|nr:MarR family winged helix-turn-helix transcriptional regulator [Oceanobacillus jordanicus]MCG3420270.1 MarR family winged helix-turn-helix transcriptional regulator [Oceanobacillus jordanicus]
MNKPTFYELINMVEQVNNANIIQFTEGLTKPIGISSLIVLSEIRKLEQCQPIELSNKLGYSKSSISIITKKLLDAGYIENTFDPHDRRKIYLSLTSAGNDMLREAEYLGQQYYENIYSVLTDEELLQYIEIQKKLLNKLKGSK